MGFHPALSMYFESTIQGRRSRDYAKEQAEKGEGTRWEKKAEIRVEERQCYYSLERISEAAPFR